jgi:tRNA-2-methylthio-N6-dimethylallyladenosine synthase
MSSKQIKNLYIHTIGCQMNVYDSERIADGLKPLGYESVSSVKTADLIIVNTCAIREKAEQKVFSFLGRLSDLKKKNSDLIIAVGGCVAQQEGKNVLDRVPCVDLVFGTHTIGRLPEMIRRIESRRDRIVDIAISDRVEEICGPIQQTPHTPHLTPHTPHPTSFVTIMQGCDNYCAYCVVPYVRGREMSRHPDDIIREIEGLVKSGVREVTLLGQNVNSYGKKENLCSFAELLARVNDIAGLGRIRFTTSHPRDLSQELMQAFGSLDKLCRHIHLPVQSGSNRILKKMNRKYTRELYLEKVEQLRQICPDIAISSDIIAGFPGETPEDFEDTLNLIRTVEYDSLFAFKYSDRPNAPAARFPDKISEDEKKERLQTVLELQEEFTIQKNTALIGTVQPVLVEGISKRQRSDENSQDTADSVQWTGRTSTNKIVNFAREDETREDFIGRVVHVRIEKGFPHSLRGTVNSE